MDTQIIQRYGEDILCYRLRTARQKKRMRYEDFDKKLIRVYREERHLCQQKSNLGWYPLDPPVQKGWKRFYVLKPEEARSRHAVFFETILQKINTYEWSSRKDFLVKKRKHGKKLYVVKRQHLEMPGYWQFKNMNFSEDQQQFFRLEQFYERWKKQTRYRYVFTEPWRFVLQVRPNMVDKIRIKDAVIESGLDTISNYLDRNDYRKRLRKLLGYNNGNDWKKYYVKEKEKYYFKNKSFSRVLDLIQT